MNERHELAVLFADIAGTTHLHAAVGSVRAKQATSRCITLLSQAAQRHQGRLVKTTEEEIMVTFSSADAAARAAIDMQKAASDQADKEALPLRIRVGFHFGAVFQDQENVFGDAVNLAARMAAQARAGQIVTTGKSLERMPSDLRHRGQEIVTTTVKGQSLAVQICELAWNP